MSGGAGVPEGAIAVFGGRSEIGVEVARRLASGRRVEGVLTPADQRAAEGLVRLNAVRGWEELSLLE